MLHTARMRLIFEDHNKKTGGKWTYVLLFTVNRYPIKFNKIRQLIPDITPRTLSIVLGKMQTNGLIYKELDLYKITSLGSLTLTSVLTYIENAKKLDGGV
jgi:DNA-binding HxlR family transcriptional regulator